MPSDLQLLSRQEKRDPAKQAQASKVVGRNAPGLALRNLLAGSTSQRTRAAMHLQQKIGNRAVQRLLRHDPTLQRCSCLGCQCGSGKHETDLQRTTAQSELGKTSGLVSGELERTRGGGDPLDAEIRSKLEPVMNADFQNVRIHTATYADVLARSVAAEAFTTGADIYFQNGRYQPDSPSGLHLLAHELTHTIQQSRGTVAGVPWASGIQVSDPNDSFERDAEITANRALDRISDSSANSTMETPARVSSTEIAVAQRQSYASAPVLQRKTTTDNQPPDWTAEFTPQAKVRPDNAPVEVGDFDTDPAHETLDIAPNSTGDVLLFVDMKWSRGAGGGGGGATPLGDLVKACDPCEQLPSVVPDEIVEKCKSTCGEARRNFIRDLIRQVGADPCIAINHDSFFRTLCDVGTFFVPPQLTKLISTITGTLSKIAGKVESTVCKNVPLPCNNGKKGGMDQPPGTSDTGAGTATFRGRYFVDDKRNVKLAMQPAIGTSNGTGAEVVIPVTSATADIPNGVNVSLAPAIHTTGNPAQNHVSQGAFDVDLVLPAAPVPASFCCGHQVGPFVVNTDKLEDSDGQIESLRDWYFSLPPAVQASVRAGNTPIKIVGHASCTGSEEHDLELSEKRAQKVERFMRDFAGTDSHPDVFAVGKLFAQQTGESAAERRADVKIAGSVEGLEQDAALCGIGNDPGPCQEQAGDTVCPQAGQGGGAGTPGGSAKGGQYTQGTVGEGATPVSGTSNVGGDQADGYSDGSSTTQDGSADIVDATASGQDTTTASGSQDVPTKTETGGAAQS